MNIGSYAFDSLFNRILTIANWIEFRKNDINWKQRIDFLELFYLLLDDSLSFPNRSFVYFFNDLVFWNDNQKYITGFEAMVDVGVIVVNVINDHKFDDVVSNIQFFVLDCLEHICLLRSCYFIL